jgi:hypothetical protein
MLLDELLIKIGLDTDSQAMQEFEQFLDTVGSGTESAVEGLGELSKSIESTVNTDAVKDGADAVDDLKGNIDNLWATKFGADGLAKKFESLGLVINKTAIAVVALGAAFYGATVGVKNFVDGNLNALDEIKQLSNVTGEAADKIYLLGKVAEVNGSSAQAAQSSIEGLSRTIGEAAAGIGRGAKTFEQYGLSAKKANGEIKSSSELFGEISEKMQQMSDQEQIAMLAKLGIDGSMIQTLRLGNDELAEQIALAEALTLGVGNAENAEKAAAFKDALTQVSQVFIAIGEYVSLRISPSIQRLAERFTKWFAENNNFIKAILNGLGRVFSFLFELAGAIDNIIESTVGWKAVIIALGGLLLWFSRRMLLAFATNPITLAIAAIAGLILIIDDFITWLQGGDAQFGEFYQSVADGLQWISDKWGELGDWIKAKWGELGDWIKAKWGEAIAWVTSKWNAFTATFSIDNLKKVFESVKQTIIDKFKAAFGWAIDLWNSIVAKIGGEPINIQANVSTQGVRQAGLGVADLVLNAGVYAKASEVSAGGVGGTSNSDNSVKNSNNKITITQHIQGVDNPKAVADQSARAINNQLSPVIG